MSVRAVLVAAVAASFGVAIPAAIPASAANRGIVYDLFQNTAVSRPPAQNTTWAPGTTRVLAVVAYDVDRHVVSGTDVVFTGVDDRGKIVARATVRTDATGTARLSRTFWQNETWSAGAVDAAVGWATKRSLGRYVIIPGSKTLTARYTITARPNTVSVATKSTTKVTARLQKRAGKTWATVRTAKTSAAARKLAVGKAGTYRVVLSMTGDKSTYPVLSWTKP